MSAPTVDLFSLTELTAVRFSGGFTYAAGGRYDGHRLILDGKPVASENYRAVLRWVRFVEADPEQFTARHDAFDRLCETAEATCDPSALLDFVCQLPD